MVARAPRTSELGLRRRGAEDVLVMSLCSGYGGLDLGLRGAIRGTRTVCYVEREISAAGVLAARMEEGALEPAPIWSDLTTFDARPFRGCVDLLVAGFPCQGASVAGKRLGTDDARWLWPAVRRAIDDCGAPLVFLENVPGLFTVNDGEAFEEILGDLAAMGFDAEWSRVRAEQAGAPHRRDRLFLLAYASRALVAKLVPVVDVAYADDVGRPRPADVRRPQHEGLSVADAPGDGQPGSGREHEAGRRPEPDDGGTQLADTDGDRCEGERSRWLLDGLRAALGYDPDRRSGAPAMGNTDDEGLEGRSLRGRERTDGSAPRPTGGSVGPTYGGGHEWPPRPDDLDGWRGYLARGGPEPAVFPEPRAAAGAQPPLRRGSSRSSAELDLDEAEAYPELGRPDQLRLLGNGVVWQQAALAFLDLRHRILNGD